MAPKIKQTILNDCYGELFVYDVTQKGWEQEPFGFTANAQHLLTHLVKDGFSKDFNDPELASTSTKTQQNSQVCIVSCSVM